MGAVLGSEARDTGGQSQRAFHAQHWPDFRQSDIPGLLGGRDQEKRWPTVPAPDPQGLRSLLRTKMVILPFTQFRLLSAPRQ